MIHFIFYSIIYFMGIYFFYGDEDYLLEEELNKYREKLDKSFSTMNYVVHEHPSTPDLIAIIRTQPMMFGKLMVVIKCEKILSKTLDDNDIKEISKALEDNTDNLDVFFVATYPRNENEKPDARKKLFKTLSKYNVKEFQTIKTYKTAELTQFINIQAKKNKITIEQNAANALIECIGNNLRELSNEIDKLAIYSHPETKVNLKMVNEICISNQDLFNFTDYLIQGQNGKALVELKNILDKKHPMEILAALQTIVRKWVLIKLNSKSKSATEISKIVSQHEFVVKQTIQKLKNIELKYLVSIKQNLTEIEYKIKSGTSIDPVSEVENAFIR